MNENYLYVTECQTITSFAKVNWVTYAIRDDIQTWLGSARISAFLRDVSVRWYRHSMPVK